MTSRLDRFRHAQELPDAGIDMALAELRAGRKQGHWIWYIFPQLSGLGVSAQSQIYGIRGVDEATAYLSDPILSERLQAVSETLAHHMHAGMSMTGLMGSQIDALKVVSSLTLFGAVASRLAARGDASQQALARVAQEVLELAAAEGYARCRYTLDHLGAP